MTKPILQISEAHRFPPFDRRRCRHPRFISPLAAAAAASSAAFHPPHLPQNGRAAQISCPQAVSRNRTATLDDSPGRGAAFHCAITRCTLLLSSESEAWPGVCAIYVCEKCGQCWGPAWYFRPPPPPSFLQTCLQRRQCASACRK